LFASARRVHGERGEKRALQPPQRVARQHGRAALAATARRIQVKQ
jgi:hypothetical protein